MAVQLIRSAATKQLYSKRRTFPPSVLNDSYLFGVIYTFGQLCLDFLHDGKSLSPAKRYEYLMTYLDVLGRSFPDGYHPALFWSDQSDLRDSGKPSVFDEDLFSAGDHAAMLVFGAFLGRLKNNPDDAVLEEAKHLALESPKIDALLNLPHSANSTLLTAIVQVTLAKRIAEIWDRGH